MYACSKTASLVESIQLLSCLRGDWRPLRGCLNRLVGNVMPYGRVQHVALVPVLIPYCTRSWDHTLDIVECSSCRFS